MTNPDQELVDAASAVIEQRSDGFRHTVGAAARDVHGAVHTAVNVYHFTGGPCAELVVLGAAWAAGATELESIVAVGDGGRGVVPPCGRCRQVMADLHPAIRVIVPSGDGSLSAVVASELLPFGYVAGPETAKERRGRMTDPG